MVTRVLLGVDVSPPLSRSDCLLQATTSGASPVSLASRVQSPLSAQPLSCFVIVVNVSQRLDPVRHPAPAGAHQ